MLAALIATAASTTRGLVGRRTSCVMASSSAARTDVVPIAEWPAKLDNTLVRALRPDGAAKSPHESRQVMGAHYTLVRPTVPAPLPMLVACSAEVAEMLGLDPDDKDFPSFFSGGGLPKQLTCWATAYGASFTGRYGGQRGDGRAISIGQVGQLEVQLKGAGTTPFSRGFDGRAVLRSCVREFLASEAMAALGVPTTRALCVVTSGDQVHPRVNSLHFA